jgi:adenosylmethionine-8-amino-7-oxononanoate aminotransferase
VSSTITSARDGVGRVKEQILDVDDLVEFDRAHVWHPYAPSPGRVPMYPVVGASGVRMTLADGRELIDGMASWWSAIHGYHHPTLDAAATGQLGQMAHMMFGGLTHPAAVGLARRLVDMTPDGLTRVFFSDSGSVSVEVAIKMAIQYWLGEGRPAKHRLLTVRGGYHGDTFAAMSVCDPVTGMHHQFERVLTRQLFAPRPSPGFGVEFTDDDIAGMRAMLHEHADEVAAVILEPVVQGAGGMHFYAPAYVDAVRLLCDEFDVLMIADEIATGFARTGTLFACGHADVTPDIMCVGKALTGGYLSMAATLCTDAVARGVSAAESGALMHGPTFMANPLAAAVASASIDLLLGQDWPGRIAAIESALRAGLEPARALDGVADVRVLGAIGVVEMREPLTDAAQHQLVDQGVWLRPFGRLLYTLPPYITDDDDLGRITAAMVATAAAA